MTQTRRQYHDEAGQPIPGCYMSAGDSARIDASEARLALGEPEWLAKGYRAPFDCAAKHAHDKGRHGDPAGCGCGCVCDVAGNRIN